MSLQNIYFLVGAAGFVLAAIFAIVSVVYFFRADIRGVLAELSGKTRQRELAEFSADKATRKARRDALISNGEWQGQVSQGHLASPSGGSGSGSGAGVGFPPAPPAAENAPAGYPAALKNGQVSPVGTPLRASAAPATANAPAAPPATANAPAAPPASANATAVTFTVTRAIFNVHASSVVDGEGREVPCDVAASTSRGGDR